MFWAVLKHVNSREKKKKKGKKKEENEKNGSFSVCIANDFKHWRRRRVKKKRKEKRNCRFSSRVGFLRNCVKCSLAASVTEEDADDIVVLTESPIHWQICKKKNHWRSEVRWGVQPHLPCPTPPSHCCCFTHGICSGTERALSPTPTCEVDFSVLDF